MKALLFTCLLVAFQQASGINVVLFNMGAIFIAANSLPSSLATIIVGTVQVITSGITPLIVDRLGRKILLIFSGVGEVVSLVSDSSNFRFICLINSYIKSYILRKWRNDIVRYRHYYNYIIFFRYEKAHICLKNTMMKIFFFLYSVKT